MRTLDIGGADPDLLCMPHRQRRIIFALLLTAAAPVPGDVQHVPPELAMAVLGHAVDDSNGKEIGRLVDVLVGDQGQPQAAVIDFGGFMGVGDRRIAVEWGALHFAPANPKQSITLDLTQDQIKAAPEYKDVAKPAPVVVASPPPQAAAPEDTSTPR